MEARAQHATEQIVLVIPHAANYAPALVPGPRVLSENPRHLFLALNAKFDIHAVIHLKLKLLIKGIVDIAQAHCKAVVRIADDIRVQDVAAEEAFVAIVMIASKAVCVPVVVKCKLRSDAAPYRIRKYIPRFSCCFNAIDLRNCRPSSSRRIE